MGNPRTLCSDRALVRTCRDLGVGIRLCLLGCTIPAVSRSGRSTGFCFENTVSAVDRRGRSIQRVIRVGRSDGSRSMPVIPQS